MVVFFKLNTLEKQLRMRATTGMYADGKHLVKRAREEARSYLDIYRTPIPGKMIADRVCNYVQAHTLYSSVRPFGVTAILAAHDHNGPYLAMIEPSGVGWGYRGCAAGKGHKIAKTELEKLELDKLDAIQAVNEVARILLICHDDNKDKPIELEMTWIAPQTGFHHQRVPQDILDHARQLGEDSLKAQDMDD
ncbi:putative proteasome subunit alpha type-7 [Massospora cicadina]|nr:putative proteasome subunit alpha type-7 [Massospora cicadina]